MRKNIFIFLGAIIFSSCRMNPLFIRIEVPAPVTMPNSVKKVGILNRSIPNEQEKVQSAAHQVLSVQSFAMLKEGGAEGIKGLKDGLMENNRFESVVILDSMDLKSTTIGLFPAPLTWDQVESICNAQKLDALFVLEMFDTELKIAGSVPGNVTNPMQVANAVQKVNISTVVKTGWRIYVPFIRRISDEYTEVQNTSYAGGANPLITVDAILQRKEAIRQVANNCGHAYAVRILPEFVRVYRDYFIRGGNGSFKIAKRKARAGNWDGAAELWMKETNSIKHKSAGRACYNMAIINEINGHLDEAVTWAQKSYEDYGVRASLRYIDILKGRKTEQQLLERQQTQ